MFYLVAAIVYLTLAGIWIFGVLRGAKKVFLLHHLMTGMVILKMLSVLLLSIDYHFQNLVGHPGGWTIAYYTINFIKGVSLFCIVALIGSGWQFVKPFLSDKDKQIFMIVVPLQVLDNIALVIIDETIPGMRGWSSWKNIFRLVDIICCGAIIIPIVWSIKHLRDAAAASGKAARNIHRLQLFRNFYIIIVSYIYFTRIVVFMFEATLPYGSVWLTDLCTESATIALFVVVAYKFMPEDENPLLKVYDSDEEIQTNEFGEVDDLEAVAQAKQQEKEQVAAEIAAKQEVVEQHKKEAQEQEEK